MKLLNECTPFESFKMRRRITDKIHPRTICKTCWKVYRYQFKKKHPKTERNNQLEKRGRRVSLCQVTYPESRLHTAMIAFTASMTYREALEASDSN